MNSGGTVADFAFYVDRPINKHYTEDSFALSLKEGDKYGYIKKEEYNNLSEEFRKDYLPIAKTENFFLITNIKNYKTIKEKILPIFIY